MTNDVETALAKEVDELWMAMLFAIGEQEAALEAGANVVRLHTNKEAALQKAMVRDGWAPVSDEFGWQWQERGYVGQWGEHFSSGAVGVWFCEAGQWDQVRYVVEDGP